MELDVKTSYVLTWENVTGWVKRSRKTPAKKILDNVSGIARSGTLTAIISPSGAGKTTLLAILSKRFKGIAEGKIRFNGLQLSQQEMSSISGYVCQKANNYEDLTVYENLSFMARFKMDSSSTATDRHENILKIVKSLLLSHRLHATIRSLSGGQKKRLTLAVQLLTQPKILFCDEPTTGLDSYSAEQVVKLLRSLANDGKMVICSIHQPASGIFGLFDEATLLASGGKITYHGPVFSLYTHFAQLGNVCPENFNISEYIVSRVSIKQSPHESIVDQERRIEVAVDYFLHSDVHKTLKLEIKESYLFREKLDSSFDIWEYKRNSVSFCTELGWLFWREGLLFKHACKTSLIPFVAYGMVFLAISVPYYGITRANQEGVQNIIGFLSLFTTQVVYSSLSPVVNVVPHEMPIFIQETTDGVYSPVAFYLSKTCFETLIMGIQAIVFMVFAFVITGLDKTLYEFIMTAVPTLLLSFTACAYGFFLSAAFSSVSTYSLFAVPFETISFLLMGIMLKLDSLPWYIVWLKYLSFPYYAYESFNIIQWVKFGDISCERGNIDQCRLTGDAVLTSLGFSRYHLHVDFIGMLCWIFAWHIMAFIALIYKIKLFAAY